MDQIVVTESTENDQLDLVPCSFVKQFSVIEPIFWLFIYRKHLW